MSIYSIIGLTNKYTYFLCAYLLSHFVFFQPLILPSFWHLEQTQWISLFSFKTSLLINPWHPFSKQRMSVEVNVWGLFLVVESTTKAKKLANSLASFVICLGIFPDSSRKCFMFEIYIYVRLINACSPVKISAILLYSNHTDKLYLVACPK